MSLAEKYPHLAKQWHPIKNGILTPENVTPGSNKKVWWQCEKGHEWETSANARTGKNIGCPVCANKKVLVGFNDIQTTFPDVAAQWHPTKNNILPTQVTAGSGKKIWWQCEKGHEWEAAPGTRTNLKTKCPTCAKKISANKLLLPKGRSPISATHPELVTQWHPTKNTEYTPHMLLAGSEKKVWWLCDKGHEWEMSPYKRTVRNQNCPICANRTIVIGFNDLKTTNPELEEEWHPTENIFNFDELSAGAGYQATWICNKNHTWQAHIYNRTGRVQSGCPICSQRSSAPETSIADFLKENNQNIILSTRKIIPPYELDIYIPEKNIAIEFNGLYWHSENQGKHKNYHYNKWLECRKKGIQLIQIWEDDWNKNSELILNLLAHKLHFSTTVKTYARNTNIVNLNMSETKTFLESNHIQGSVEGRIRVGLKDSSNNIVACLVLKSEPNTGGKVLNLLRYATQGQVIGGFTKLLNYVEKTYSPEKIITFSDHTVSDGNLYKTTGFVADKEIRPDYMYVHKGIRNHKFGYRLKRFREDPTLQYEEGLTEKELAALNNLPRIWDAGKTRWVKEVSAQ